MRSLLWRLKRKRFSFILVALLLLFLAPQPNAASPLPEMDAAGYPAPNTGCLAPGKCHAGIEPIRAHNSGMAQQIYSKGLPLGDPNGCVLCHGGDPQKKKACGLIFSFSTEKATYLPYCGLFFHPPALAAYPLKAPLR